MKSIKTKITLLILCAIVAAVVAATAAGVAAVTELGSDSSMQILSLLCETGQKNLDSYFKSVEQSVELVSDYVKADLVLIGEDGLKEQLSEHISRSKDIFEKTAKNTNGVLTYYYRIDPDFSDTEKGFWFIYSDAKGYSEHEVTDIRTAIREDPEGMVWFTEPKSTGTPVWLEPYVTSSLFVKVISYNAPIYCGDTFIGVVGIEIDYSTMADQVDNIRLYDNGYAFLSDADGDLVYHPFFDVTDPSAPAPPEVPSAIKNAVDSDNPVSVQYTLGKVAKRAVSHGLHNKMILTVTVPVSELNGNWQKLASLMILIAVALIAVFVVLTLNISGRIVKPLKELTKAAEQLDAGNYDLSLDYGGRDEVGILTNTINKLIGHLKGYIGDLNDLAYGDALTSVKNKGAFDIYLREIQEQIDDPDKTPQFAIGMFDCNDLKIVNDKYGHEKGDLYLKNSCHFICRVFRFSPVFRIGGDEFAVILRNHDYEKRKELAQYFAEKCVRVSQHAEVPWEKMMMGMGIAVYDPERDSAAYDVVRRADTLMYENKRAIKENRKPDLPID